MKKAIKRTCSLMLALVMMLALAACGGAASSSSAPASSSAAASSAAGGSSEPAAPATSYPDQVTEPVTITLWHSRGAGAHLTEMQRVVEAFNETNEFGITVQEEFIGTNTEIYAKLATAIASGDNCEIALLGFTTVGELAAEGVLADMAPYAERDGFEMDNLLECWDRGLIFDGEFLAMPYIRSASLIYYDKNLLAEMGHDTIPQDIETFTELIKQIKDERDTYGYIMLNQTDFVQGAFIKSMNGEGLVSEDGLVPNCLYDGSLETVTDWWRTGVEEGYMMPYTSTDASNNQLTAFYNGDVATIAASSGNMSTILKNAGENGIEVGVSPLPGFNGSYISSTGGSNMVIVDSNNSQQEVAAAWEFLKFLVSDEQQIFNSQNTGYVPVTQSAGSTQAMADFWAENPTFKSAYDTLDYAIEGYASPYLAAWQGAIVTTFDNVILDGSMTVEEGMEYLKGIEGTIFP